MIAAPVQYAKPVEVKLWEEERTPSAYMEFVKPRRSLVLNDADYSCQFFLATPDKEDDIAEWTTISYYKVVKANGHLIKSEKKDIQREQAQDEVRAFANFQDDWDGYGAVRPVAECLNHALEIIRNKSIKLEYLTDIYPNPNGTLTLEWEQDDNEIGLEVGSHEFSYFAHFGEHHSYNNRKPYVAEEIEKLSEYIAFMR